MTRPLCRAVGFVFVDTRMRRYAVHERDERLSSVLTGRRIQPVALLATAFVRACSCSDAHVSHHERLLPANAAVRKLRACCASTRLMSSGGKPGVVAVARATSFPNCVNRALRVKSPRPLAGSGPRVTAMRRRAGKHVAEANTEIANNVAQPRGVSLDAPRASKETVIACRAASRTSIPGTCCPVT